MEEEMKKKGKEKIELTHNATRKIEEAMKKAEEKAEQGNPEDGESNEENCERKKCK
jgi:hypothetical protein